MNEKILWYVADPMCSWCWGFAPVIEQVRNSYRDRSKMELLLGGLRPGTKHPLPVAQRQEILGHWQAVHRATGQVFQFAGAMPEGFIYDTEPPEPGSSCRFDTQARCDLHFFWGGAIGFLC